MASETIGTSELLEDVKVLSSLPVKIGGKATRFQNNFYTKLK